jgi:putative aldouronate transport system permease protein
MSRLFDAVNVLAMLVFLAIMVFPLLNQLALSLNDGYDAARGGIFLWPRKFSLDSYKLLLSHPKLLRGAFISILRVTAGTLTGVFMTGLLAYVITRPSFSGRRFLRVLFIVTLYFSGGLIPFYLLVLKLGMTNTFTVYWLPSLINAYYMLIMASYMQNIPDSLTESARMDGASEVRIFLSIIIPISTPVLAAISIFTAVGHWNSWFDVLIYNPSGKWDTLQVYLRRLLLEVEALATIRDQQLLQSKLRNVSTVTYRAATTVAVTLPIVIVYPFLQRYFISGITLGAVKG